MKTSLSEYLVLALCLFGMVSFISVAGANAFLGLSTLLFLILLFKNKDVDILYEDISCFIVILCLAGSLFVSALFSGNIGASLKVWADFFLWRFMPFMIVFFMLAKKEYASKVLGSIFCGFFISCLYAIYQGVFVFKLNIENGRADSFVGHPMTLAGWSCILLPILLVYVFRNDISKNIKICCMFLFSVGCAALVFNSTRGAWLAVSIVLLLISLPYILQSKKLLVGFTTFLIILGLILSNSTTFMSRVNSISDTKTNWSNVSRFIIWNTAYDIFKEHPVLGVGLGNFKSEYKNSVVDSALKRNINLKKWQKKHLVKLDHAHNNFMQMLGENGLVGLFGYVCAFGYILWSGLKNYLLNQNPYSLMIVGSTSALLLQGLTEYNFGNGAVMKIYWLVLACLIVLANKYNGKTNHTI